MFSAKLASVGLALLVAGCANDAAPAMSNVAAQPSNDAFMRWLLDPQRMAASNAAMESAQRATVPDPNLPGGKPATQEDLNEVIRRKQISDWSAAHPMTTGSTCLGTRC